LTTSIFVSFKYIVPSSVNNFSFLVCLAFFIFFIFFFFGFGVGSYFFTIYTNGIFILLGIKTYGGYMSYGLKNVSPADETSILLNGLKLAAESLLKV
jgi:hypothetical protein